MRIPRQVTGDEWWMRMLPPEGFHLNGVLCEPIVMLMFCVYANAYNDVMRRALGDGQNDER